MEYKLDSQTKESLEKAYTLLGQLQISGEQNIFILANTFTSIRQILQTMNYQEMEAKKGISIDNTKG